MIRGEDPIVLRLSVGIKPRFKPLAGASREAWAYCKPLINNILSIRHVHGQPSRMKLAGGFPHGSRPTHTPDAHGSSGLSASLGTGFSIGFLGSIESRMAAL